MNGKRNTRPKSAENNAPSMPIMPGIHEVHLASGQTLTFHECFMQLGTAQDIPGALIIFHGSGMFTLAAFGAGEWSYAVRVTPPPALSAPAEVPQVAEVGAEAE